MLNEVVTIGNMLVITFDTWYAIVYHNNFYITSLLFPVLMTDKGAVVTPITWSEKVGGVSSYCLTRPNH